MFSGAGGAAPAAEKDDGKLLDLRDKIETAMSYAKNEASGFPMSNLFIGDSRLGCKSDTDEQLIIHIEFQEFVKVRVFQSSAHIKHQLALSLAHTTVQNERSEASSLPNSTMGSTPNQTQAR